MITHADKTILYKCPQCSGMVRRKVDIFTLSDTAQTFRCDCGKSGITLSRSGQKIRLSWPCLFCGETHHKYITVKDFIHSDLLSSQCSVYGVPGCFLGSEERTQEASEELDEMVDLILDSMNFGDYFFDKEVFIDTLEILDKFAEEKRISCTCGELKLKTKLNYDNIELVCSSCGASIMIPTTKPEQVALLRESDGIFLMNSLKAP